MAAVSSSSSTSRPRRAAGLAGQRRTRDIAAAESDESDSETERARKPKHKSKKPRKAASADGDEQEKENQPPAAAAAASSASSSASPSSKSSKGLGGALKRLAKKLQTAIRRAGHGRPQENGKRPICRVSEGMDEQTARQLMSAFPVTNENRRRITWELEDNADAIERLLGYRTVGEAQFSGRVWVHKDDPIDPRRYQVTVNFEYLTVHFDRVTHLFTIESRTFFPYITNILDI
jgi:hypothetical protein